jgi:hypothetical protein
MKKLTAILLIFISIITQSQPLDTLKNNWKPSLVLSAGINQIAFNNWIKGGQNSVAWTFLGDFHYDKITNPLIIKNEVKVTYGRSKSGGDEDKTTDNDLFIEDLISYNFGWAASPFIANEVRTQVATGYDYHSSPATQISDFFDPGYITQSLGFTYDKYPHIITRLGIGFQEIVTKNYRRYTDPANLMKTFKFETGIESVTDFKFKLDDNIEYTGKFRLFSQFSSLDVWDVRFDNMIVAKVSKYISVNFTYLLDYEKAQTPLTQTEEGLQVGITYSIF